MHAVSLRRMLLTQHYASWGDAIVGCGGIFSPNTVLNQRFMLGPRCIRFVIYKGKRGVDLAQAAVEESLKALVLVFVTTVMTLLLT